MEFKKTLQGTRSKLIKSGIGAECLLCIFAESCSHRDVFCNAYDLSYAIRYFGMWLLLELFSFNTWY